jgi:hypothetical protein
LRLALVLALGLAPAPPAAALGHHDVAEIRAAIHRQIEAAQVCQRELRPASVSFLDLLVMSDDVVQQVQVTDAAGEVWVAYYALQRQLDGRWQMHGCRLVQPNRTISA